MLTKASEYQIGFLKLLWKHGKPDPNFQDAKIAIRGHLRVFFQCFMTP